MSKPLDSYLCYALDSYLYQHYFLTICIQFFFCCCSSFYLKRGTTPPASAYCFYPSSVRQKSLNAQNTKPASHSFHKKREPSRRPLGKGDKYYCFKKGKISKRSLSARYKTCSTCHMYNTLRETDWIWRYQYKQKSFIGIDDCCQFIKH